ncbi:zinc finger CW-type PWWP domain protein 1-like [Cylas formicarius]|uniref:zinc finger CW-type PWWP domain protein 1-like n=1 Tax=Cylas formicarius TaxID=197179 RepID=UPI002958590D|nr:zinc finger CW-type PWWP domain protein 1-like [Cylas formicarius]
MPMLRKPKKTLLSPFENSKKMHIYLKEDYKENLRNNEANQYLRPKPTKTVSQLNSSVQLDKNKINNHVELTKVHSFNVSVMPDCSTNDQFRNVDKEAPNQEKLRQFPGEIKSKRNILQHDEVDNALGYKEKPSTKKTKKKIIEQNLNKNLVESKSDELIELAELNMKLSQEKWSEKSKLQLEELDKLVQSNLQLSQEKLRPLQSPSPRAKRNMSKDNYQQANPKRKTKDNKNKKQKETSCLNHDMLNNIIKNNIPDSQKNKDKAKMKKLDSFANKNETHKTRDNKQTDEQIINRMTELQNLRDVGVYVYCDICDKIRYLADYKDPLDLPEKWYCYMNPDLKYNKCSDPEYPLSKETEQLLIRNKFNAGSIVWAKMEGYPWWPAMVEDDPDIEDYYWLEDDSDEPTYYHVTFFDTKQVTRAWIKTEYLRSFEINAGSKCFLSKKKSIYSHRVEMSTKTAQKAYKMQLLDRLKTFGFVNRFSINKNRRKVNKNTEKKHFKSNEYINDQLLINAKIYDEMITDCLDNNYTSCLDISPNLF